MKDQLLITLALLTIIAIGGVLYYFLIVRPEDRDMKKRMEADVTEKFYHE